MFHDGVISHASDVIGLRCSLRRAYKRLHDRFESDSSFAIEKNPNQNKKHTKMFYFLLYLSLQIVLFGAWVSGTLDPYQKKFQEMILDAMGETKVSYGLKSKLSNIISLVCVRADVISQGA